MASYKRHILLMSSWYPTRIDPFSGNFIQRFGVLLTEKYQVTAVHTIGDSQVQKIEIDEQNIEGVRTLIAYHPVSKNKVLHWLYQRIALRKLYMRLEHVDLVFAHVFLNRGFQFAKAQRYFNCPLIVLEHASYFRSDKRKHFSTIQKSIIRKASRNAQQILAVSERLKADMRSFFPTTNIQVIPEFVKLDKFHLKDSLSPKCNSFLHISTLDPNTKNPSYLFEGFRSAVKADIERKGESDLHLKIVSDKNTTMWQNWVSANKLDKYFSFEGPATWDEIAQYVQTCDALILTSSYETFSIVLVEAWLTGTPVISTVVGVAQNMPDFLGEQIHHDDIPSFMHAIEQMQLGSKLYDPKQIREYALQFTDGVVLEKLVSIFEKTFIKDE